MTKNKSMKYFIAYSDVNYDDFQYAIPYISDTHYSSLEEAEKAKKQLYEEEECTNMTIFAVSENEELPEIVDWEFISYRCVGNPKEDYGILQIALKQDGLTNEEINELLDEEEELRLLEIDSPSDFVLDVFDSPYELGYDEFNDYKEDYDWEDGGPFTLISNFVDFKAFGNHLIKMKKYICERFFSFNCSKRVVRYWINE